MDRKIIEKRLVSYADWYAATQGYTIGTDARGDFEEMAKKAINNMFGQDLPKRMQSKHTAMILQAEASFAMMISTMIQASKTIKGYSARKPDTIGEETLGWATNRLCPLFPIC